MRVFGIICEYNPFHRGHKWQIDELRRLAGEEECAVVCAMSGDFVQRGDFAIERAHARAEAAVYGGADLVLELPLPWAISSAEGFARGGVSILVATGVVDTLVFGSECGNAAKLQRAAKALLRADFPDALREELAKGLSFAAARESAARALIGEDAAVLREPNDILGVEYCKALLQSGSTIAPLAILRKVVGHNGGAAKGFASASHIRELLTNGEDASADVTAADVPPEVPYLRVLACNERGRKLLKTIKKTGSAPVLTKSADVRALSEEAQKLFALTARAADQYVLAYPELRAARGSSAWTEGPVIV